jgi:triosephosphate isomerase
MSKSAFWVGTNWKMHKTHAEGMAFAEALADADAARDPRIQRFIIPPFTMVRDIKARLASSSVYVGAQNMHWADEGQYTGEISPVMLKDCNLDLVELGHSERREHFGETDEGVGLKTEAALRHGLIPLVCIGETLAERDAGKADAVLKRQIEGAFGKLADDAGSKTILLAYEPVWAIGVNGIPATADYADARHAFIADVARSILGRDVPVLYGGSVNAGNCEELTSQPHIDGLFIGRSAWNVVGYLDILDKVAKTL